MAQQQLEAYRLGRQLIPALPDNLAAQFGTWVVNYVRDNPNQVANIAREATTWIQQNAPQLGVWPILIYHQSPGLRDMNDKNWVKSNDYFKLKWK